MNTDQSQRLREIEARRAQLRAEVKRLGDVMRQEGRALSEIEGGRFRRMRDDLDALTAERDAIREHTRG